MNRLIADHLPVAYPASHDCPPAEIWAAVLNLDLPARRCDELQMHADNCNSCATERTLAQRFLDDSGIADEDVDWIVKQLEQSHPTSARVVRFPGRWSRYAQPLLGLAAAAMLVMAFAPLFPVLSPGVSNGPVETGTLRGSEVFVQQPSGDVIEMPIQLAWIEHQGADNYRLAIYAVDDELIWADETDGDSPRVAVPDNLLQRYVTYYWQVEAIGSDGNAIARSRKTRFQVMGER